MEVRAAAAAKQTATYTPGKPLARQVNDYLAATRTSIATLANEIPGYSRPTISRYLAGKYDGDITTIEKLLAEWLAQRTGEAVDVPERPGKTGRKPAFLETRDAVNVLGVCQSCQEYIGLGIVVARSGYGKTYSLRQYAKLPRVAYIECDDTMSSRDLVEAIEKTLGIPSGYGTIWKRVNGIRDFFNTNKGWLLVIDEADKLVSKYTQKKMEILRAIYDQSDVGVVIAGEPKLEAAIKTYLARMANRVDFYISLKGLTPSEVEKYVSEFEVAPEAMVELKTAIMGRAEVTAAQMAAFCLSKNAEPRLPSCTVEELASLFLAEGEAEGVRGDVAFAQSLHETGFFKYGGIVQPGQNNYGGLGALNGNAAGQAASFPDPRSGVRAQIQHLKAYATTEPLMGECIDPRFSLVARGVAEFVEWLGAADNPSGRGWAVPGAGYGGKIVSLLGQIKATEAPEPTPPTPPDDGYPEGTPAWQKEGFEALVERGVINSPEYWKTRFDKTMTAGEILAILGRM